MGKTVLNIILVILVILVAGLAIFYFLGKRMQARQAESQAAIDAAKQVVSMLIIDKKKMKLTEAGFPKAVVDQSPKYARIMKVPVVKAKVGPRIMTLMADPSVFDLLPLKTECKVVVSGIYITGIKSVRGGSIPKAPEKKGIAKLIEKLRAKRQA